LRLLPNSPWNRKPKLAYLVATVGAADACSAVAITTVATNRAASQFAVSRLLSLTAGVRPTAATEAVVAIVVVVTKTAAVTRVASQVATAAFNPAAL
jgi:hypothetical protein